MFISKLYGDLYGLDQKWIFCRTVLYFLDSQGVVRLNTLEFANRSLDVNLLIADEFTLYVGRSPVMTHFTDRT